MSLGTLYAGPGKVYYNSLGLQGDGDGAIVATLDEKTTQRSFGMAGRVRETLDDQVVTVNITPFDNWGLMTTLFPTFLGVTTGANTGLLVVGTDPHTGSNVPLKIWKPSGQLYNFVRAAITKHPDLHLGNGQALYGGMSFTCLGDLTKNPGDSSFLLAGNAITESAAADPGGPMTVADFVNGVWTGAWGTTAGWGGDGGAALQAEDFWTITSEIKYVTYTIQKCSRKMTLASVNFMAKCRLVGPTHSQLAAELLSHTLGESLAVSAGADLVLTGPSSKTITLKNAEPKGAGFEFGGTKLGTGEVGFVNSMTFTTGVPQPLMVISA